MKSGFKSWLKNEFYKKFKWHKTKQIEQTELKQLPRYYPQKCSLPQK